MAPPNSPVDGSFRPDAPVVVKDSTLVLDLAENTPLYDDPPADMSTGADTGLDNGVEDVDLDNGVKDVAPGADKDVEDVAAIEEGNNESTAVDVNGFADLDEVDAALLVEVFPPDEFLTLPEVIETTPAQEVAVKDDLTGLAMDIITDARPRDNSEGLHASVVLHVDKKLCPEYDPTYVRSLGSAQHILGLRTTVSMYGGQGLVPHVLIRLGYHTARKYYKVGFISIQLGARDLAIYHHFNKDSVAEKLFPLASPTFSMFAQEAVCKALPVPSRMTIKGPRSALFVSFNKHFEKSFASLDGIHAAAAARLQQFLNDLLVPDEFILHLARPAIIDVDGKPLSSWPDLSPWFAPYDGLAAFCRDAEGKRELPVRELTVDKIVLPNWNTTNLAPEPIHSQVFFLSEKHRAVATIGGVADEIRYQNMRADIGEKASFEVKFYPLPSPWLPDKNNKSLYGHEVADSKDVLYMAVVRITAANKDLIPVIGDHCVLTTNQLPVKSHMEPNRKDAEHLRAMALDIHTSLTSAHAYADGHTHDRRQAFLRRSIETSGPDESEVIDEEDFDESGIWFRAFLSHAEPRLSGYLDMDLIKSYKGHDIKHKTSVCLRAVIQDLDVRPGEDQPAHIQRLSKWLESRPETHGEERWSSEGITFRGRRVAPPPGHRFSHCIILVERPPQPNYPAAYRAPYLMVEFPDIGFPTSMAAFSSHAFPDTIMPTPDNPFPDVPVDDAVACTLSITPQLTTLKHEGICSHLMNNNANGSDAQAYWRWTERFESFPDCHRRDLVAVLPGLESLPDHPEVPEDVLDTLRNTKAGKLMLAGAPGSGKTRFAINVAQHALSGVCYPARGRASLSATLPTIDKPSVPIQSEDNTALDAEIEGPKPGQDFVNQNRPELPLPDASTRVRRAPASFVPVVAKSPSLSAILDKSEPVRIAFAAPSHAMIDDAYARFEAINASVVKVYTWSAEMANLMMPPPDPRPVLKMPKNVNNAAKSALVKHIDMLELEKDDPTNARNDPHSLSNLALSLTPDSDADKRLLMLGRQQLKTSRADYNHNKARIKEAAAKLLWAALDTVSVVVATPVALRTLRNNTSFLPSLILLEEVGRWPESLLAVPFACWPETATLMTGDPRQFSPVVTTLKSLLRESNIVVWKDSWGPQRSQSLLHRAESEGAVDMYRSVNYRAYGNIIAWASRMFYGGEMVTPPEHSRLIKPQLNIRSYFSRFSPKIDFCGAFLDLPHARDVPVGDSWTNPHTARVCIELAVDMLRSVQFVSKQNYRDKSPAPQQGKVLIITPYSMQRQLLRCYLKDIGPHVIPEGWIDIRTVDDSPSHEAEVVIADFTRSKGIGFMDAADRLAVMTTRANYCTVYVGRVRNLTQSRALNSLVTLHQNAGALLKLRKDTANFCNRCASFGHLRSQCETKPSCQSCKRKNRDHCGRDCRAPTYKASPLLSVSVRPFDNVKRDDVLSDCIVEEAVDEKTRELKHAHKHADFFPVEQAASPANENNTAAEGNVAPADAGDTVTKASG